MDQWILLVDDEPDILKTTRTILETKGYRVEEARDGKEALDKLRSGHYDLMILDLLMPRLSGYDVLRSLSSKERDELPVVILTAKVQDKDVLKGYAMGATYFVTKPFQNKTVLNIVDYLLENMSPCRRMQMEMCL